MAKFAYHMQNILDIKCKLESQAKTAFADANNRCRKEEDRLGALVSRKKMYDLKARALMQGTLDMREIQTNRNAIEAMKGAIQNQSQVVTNAKKTVEVARQKLESVRKDKKTHEKLKEKEFEEYLFELGREEIKLVDELVSYKFHSAIN